MSFINKHLHDRLVVPVYHVGSLRDNNSFCNNYKLQFSNEDGYWIGKGMYFWDNFSSAVYWYKLNKNKYNRQMSIAKATLNISTDELLDLTDRYQITNFSNAFHVIYNDVKSSKNNHINIRKFKTSGGRINWFYHIYRKRIGVIPFKAVKVMGDYHMWQHATDKIFKQQEDYPNPHITDKNKLIFTVRSPSVIINREVIALCNTNKNTHKVNIEIK